MKGETDHKINPEKQEPGHDSKENVLVCPLSMFFDPRYCVEERCTFWINSRPHPDCLLKIFFHYKFLLMANEYKSLMKDSEFNSSITKRGDLYSYG